MNRTYIYIFIILIIIFGIYKFFWPSLDKIKEKTMTTLDKIKEKTMTTLDKIKEKTIVSINKFILYMRTTFIIPIKNKKDEFKRISLPDNYNEELKSNINKSTDKENIYNIVTIYLEDIRLVSNQTVDNFETNLYEPDIDIKLLREEVNKRIDELLKELKF